MQTPSLVLPRKRGRKSMQRQKVFALITQLQVPRSMQRENEKIRRMRVQLGDASTSPTGADDG